MSGRCNARSAWGAMGGQTGRTDSQLVATQVPTLRTRNGAYRSQPTAMSFSADGRRALIVTYKDAYLYRRDVGQTWLDALNRSPQRIDIPQFAQTEAGGMTPDGRSAFIASEQLPAAMVETALP